jgi:hypothetical protein
LGLAASKSSNCICWSNRVIVRPRTVTMRLILWLIVGRHSQLQYYLVGPVHQSGRIDQRYRGRTRPIGDLDCCAAIAEHRQYCSWKYPSNYVAPILPYSDHLVWTMLHYSHHLVVVVPPLPQTMAKWCILVAVVAVPTGAQALMVHCQIVS